MDSCVFCAIAGGAAPARLVYSDDDVVAFLDIRPIRPGHTLVIPRRHVPDLAGLEDDVAETMFAAARRIGAALRQSSIAADGVNLAVNDGAAAFQTVFHAHMHVVPRHHGDRLKFIAGFVARRDADPDATADAIRAVLPPAG